MIGCVWVWWWVGWWPPDSVVTLHNTPTATPTPNHSSMPVSSMLYLPTGKSMDVHNNKPQTNTTLKHNQSPTVQCITWQRDEHCIVFVLGVQRVNVAGGSGFWTRSMGASSRRAGRRCTMISVLCHHSSTYTYLYITATTSLAINIVAYHNSCISENINQLIVYGDGIKYGRAAASSRWASVTRSEMDDKYNKFISALPTLSHLLRSHSGPLLGSRMEKNGEKLQ